MKRADIEKMARDMEAIGYEILEMKALTYSTDASHRKIITGAYEIKIAPIKVCEETRVNGNKI